MRTRTATRRNATRAILRSSQHRAADRFSSSRSPLSTRSTRRRCCPRSSTPSAATVVRDVAAFTAGVFAVSTAGGLILVFGPGRALLHFVSQPRPHLLHVLEAAAGVALLAAAAFLWRTRAKVADRLADQRPRAGGSALLVGRRHHGHRAADRDPVLRRADRGHRRRATARSPTSHSSSPTTWCSSPRCSRSLRSSRCPATAGPLLAQRLRVHLVRHAPIALPALVALLGVALLAVGLAGLLRH